MFIDTHAHLTSPRITDLVDEMLQRARLHRISKIVNICTDETSLHNGLKLKETVPWIYNSAATTPHDVDKEGAAFFPMVEETAREGHLVALGETGLDFHYEHSPRAVQREYLLRYFALAIATRKFANEP